MITVACFAGSAQTQDTSGNRLLTGSYRFRQLAVKAVDLEGGVKQMIAADGTITFDGAGRYSLTGGSADMANPGQRQTLTLSGVYAIGANGVGFLTNPLFPADAIDFIYGAVAQGVFIGSSTEGQVNDLFIAVPPASTQTFTGTYWTGLLDFSSPGNTVIKNALFQLTPDAQGGLGTLILSGQASDQSAPAVTQTVSGAGYTVAADGGISLTVPVAAGATAATGLFTGTKTAVQSSDGAFILGWTPGGWDIFFGIRAGAATSNGNLLGTYYLAALEDAPFSGNPCGNVDSLYGSAAGDGAGNQIVHKRLASPFCSAIDLQFTEAVPIAGNSNTTDRQGYLYRLGNGGKAFIAVGTRRVFSLTVGIHANDLPATGVFLDPTGVINAASYAPITMSISVGELLTLKGVGLSPVTQAVQGGQVFPQTLGGVQVRINGTPAPLEYISSTQINAVVPYGITSSIANVQVSNNGTLSNTVSLFMASSAPGIFSLSQTGVGNGTILHANGDVVTSASPAQAGEYLQIFLTGLGAVSPALVAGIPPPLSPFSLANVYTKGALSVYFNDYDRHVFPEANVIYAGLAPQFAGLYQLNVQVPAGVGPGDVYVEIVTDSADVNQATVPVGTGASASIRTSGEEQPLRWFPKAPPRRSPATHE